MKSSLCLACRAMITFKWNISTSFSSPGWSRQTGAGSGHRPGSTTPSLAPDTDYWQWYSTTGQHQIAVTFVSKLPSSYTLPSIKYPTVWVSEVSPIVWRTAICPQLWFCDILPWSGLHLTTQIVFSDKLG